MKQIEFEHFKKAPHPFEQYGNLPPAAYRNRSVPQGYGSLPQGQEAFVNKVGKKQYEGKHQSSIKQHWLGINENDSLSMELAKQNHRVLGKSLETRDIEGAQGGSLKSPAVKYKQRAQQLKMYGKLNGIDHYDIEQQEYRLQMQNAVKSQYSNDLEIGKLISKKGQGHTLNPQKNQSVDKSSNISKNSKRQVQQENHQYFLKEKYDNFESKNQQYKQFFNGLHSKEDNYGDFFSKLKENDLSRQPKDQTKRKVEKVNTFDKYDSIDMPTPKITSREHEYGLSERFQTIQPESSFEGDLSERRTTYDFESDEKLLKNYKPPNFAKRSLQNQFKEEQHLGVSLNLSRVSKNNGIGDENSLSSSRKSQNNTLSYKDTRKQYLERQLARKFNPTNLSHVIGSGSFA